MHEAVTAFTASLDTCDSNVCEITVSTIYYSGSTHAVH